MGQRQQRFSPRPWIFANRAEGRLQAFDELVNRLAEGGRGFRSPLARGPELGASQANRGTGQIAAAGLPPRTLRPGKVVLLRSLSAASPARGSVAHALTNRKIGTYPSRVGVEGLGRNPRRFAKLVRLRRAGQAGCLQDFRPANIEGNDCVGSLPRFDRRKETGHQAGLKEANAEINCGELDVG